MDVGILRLECRRPGTRSGPAASTTVKPWRRLLGRGAFSSRASRDGCRAAVRRQVGGGGDTCSSAAPLMNNGCGVKRYEHPRNALHKSKPSSLLITSRGVQSGRRRTRSTCIAVSTFRTGVVPALALGRVYLCFTPASALPHFNRGVRLLRLWILLK